MFVPEKEGRRVWFGTDTEDSLNENNKICTSNSHCGIYEMLSCYVRLIQSYLGYWTQSNSVSPGFFFSFFLFFFIRTIVLLASSSQLPAYLGERYVVMQVSFIICYEFRKECRASEEFWLDDLLFICLFVVKNRK